MHLTTFTDYTLRVLIFVAAQPGGRATIGDVARAFDISGNHLTKVVHFLGRAGFLANVRGRGGGLRLARPAADINLGAVVRAAEGDVRPVECLMPGHSTCAIEPGCRLKGVFAEAVAAFFAVLDRHSLADLVANRDVLVVLLERGQPGAARPGARPPAAPAASRGPAAQ